MHTEPRLYKFEMFSSYAKFSVMHEDEWKLFQKIDLKEVSKSMLLGEQDDLIKLFTKMKDAGIRNLASNHNNIEYFTGVGELEL